MSSAGKMQIGVDARNLCGPITGIATYMLDLCHSLHDRGHELTLYAPQKLRSNIELPADIAIRSSNFPGLFGKIFWSAFVFPRQLAADKPEIIWGPAHRLPAVLPDSIARVVTIHDLVWVHAPETMKPSGRMIERLLMPRAVGAADVICADSSSTKKDLIAQFPSAVDKVRIVHPSSQSIVDDAPAMIDHGETYILFVGTNEPRKNLERVIEAFSRLSPQHLKSVRLKIVGGKGWKSSTAPELANRAGIANRVDVLGYVSNEELGAIYAGARCLVFPSLYEGFGLPIVEANLRGVPVITSDISSMPEVAGDAAILVDPRDIDAIEDALKTMLDDHETHSRLAVQAKQNAARFTRSEAANGLEAAFREAMELRTVKYGKQIQR